MLLLAMGWVGGGMGCSQVALTASVVLETILAQQKGHERDVAIVHGLERDAGAAMGFRGTC